MVYHLTQLNKWTNWVKFRWAEYFNEVHGSAENEAQRINKNIKPSSKEKVCSVIGMSKNQKVSLENDATADILKSGKQVRK